MLGVTCYDMTRCYLTPDKSKHTPARQAGTQDLPIPEGWKAELTYRWLDTYRDGLPVYSRSSIKVETGLSVEQLHWSRKIR